MPQRSPSSRAAAVAVVLWLAVVALTVTTPPGGGANIGAGFLALLALGVTLGAAVGVVRAAWWGPARWTGAASIACSLLWVVGAMTDRLPTGVLDAFRAASVLALLVACLLVRRESPPAG